MRLIEGIELAHDVEVKSLLESVLGLHKEAKG